MNRHSILLVAILLTGCVSTQVSPEVEAVRDLISVSELNEIDNFRSADRLNYQYVNDYYVAVTQGSRHYLLEFRSRCFNLRRNQYSPSMIDYRRDPTYIWASWDTIRGCPIDKIYQLTEDQLAEVRGLDAG